MRSLCTWITPAILTEMMCAIIHGSCLHKEFITERINKREAGNPKDHNKSNAACSVNNVARIRQRLFSRNSEPAAAVF